MIRPKEIIKSRRRTLALVIDHDGELIVRAPFCATNNEIRLFIEEKEDWIMEKSMEVKKRAAKHPNLTLAEGEFIEYLGEKYRIHRTHLNQVFLSGKFINLPDGQDAKDILIAWYKKRASQVLKERVAVFAEIMNVEPCGVRITSAKTRWGSCSYQNHLNFSWRLVMCPMDVVDYVVVHELSHIYHKDHSKNFWKSVSKVDVSYLEHERWLKENQRLMEVI